MHKSRKMFITKMNIKVSYMINVQVVLRLCSFSAMQLQALILVAIV